MTTHALSVAIAATSAAVLLTLTVNVAASRHRRAKTNRWLLAASGLFACAGVLTAFTGPGHGPGSGVYTILSSLYFVVAQDFGRRRAPRKQSTKGSEH
ncbi:hypothetical protein C9F11_43135 (plasmid) [Streptomyces sp. YIM 121038]|uniref:hypothetical protein n=1 Tax=Streptomyces sp. YIM 121038 TaxID=2136401 RepID=UPI0011101EE1|nr:hypothetical protein [Streptomyces sp. YIM 121038]QCX82207.1 hypothetical protein C9F11_43135 [Streptomyces sp. YIM 121038]